jgi:TRAP-type C4-dicarboxylate transport system substrate-binding protein
MKGKRTVKTFTLTGIISLILLVVMIAALVGCGKTAETVTTTKTEVETSTKTEVETATKTEVETATKTEVVEPITLVYTQHDPPGGFWAIFSKAMFDEVEKRTGGQVKIEGHYGGELAADFVQAYQAVLQGTVDIAFTSPAEIAGSFPVNNLMQFSNWSVRSQRSQVYTELYQKFPEVRAEWSQVKVLCLTALYEGPMASSVPYRKLEDLEGRKYTGAGEINAKKVQALGLTPVSVSPPDMFMSIQTGLVDGVTVGWFYYRDFGLSQVMPYVTRVPLSQFPFAWVMNLDKWNELPSDVQEVFEDMFESGYNARLCDDMLWEEETEIRSEAPSTLGSTIIELPPDELARWAQLDGEVAEEYATDLEDEGLPGMEILEEIFNLEEKYAVEILY